MINRIKKLFVKEVVHIHKIELDIKVPKFDTKIMFSNKDQAKEFYLFLCGKYINLIRERKIETAEELEKLIQNFVILGEGIQYYGLKETYSIR